MRGFNFLVILLFLAHAQAREISAVKTQAKITLDGKISSLEWPTGIFQSKFIQMEPNPGKLSTERTAVAVQYNDKNIYVAFICYKSDPDPVIARETRRDQLVKQDDVVSLYWIPITIPDPRFGL